MIRVELGPRSYDVVVDGEGYVGLADVLKAVAPGAARAIVVVTDDNVGPLWMPTLRRALLAFPLHTVVLPAGPEHKTIATWTRCLDAFMEAGGQRTTPILALGGGVVGDIAGFAASTALRGVPFVQLPTSLLAMVDASVGGKTAVDHAAGRNLVGAFHQPSLVWAALPTLSTLPDAEFRAGLGEVVKTALVGDPALFDALETHAEALGSGHGPLHAIVEACVSTKARIVAADETEQGLRAVLNAGHTVGHALELILGPTGIRHGEAVAIGLVAEARFAVRTGVCNDSTLPDRTASLLRRLGLPTECPDVDPALLNGAIAVDKKGRGDMLCLPLPVGVGTYALVETNTSMLAQQLIETQSG